MKWMRRIKLQASNIFVMNASDLSASLRRCVRFPIDYYLRDGQCGFPSNITLLITFRCNLRCDMCFFKENVFQRKHDELSFDEIVAFVDEVAPRRPGLYITGGEPFVRKDLPDIIAYAKSRKLKVGINTNGTLLDEEKIAQLLIARPDYLIFSIEGPEEVHNQVRGKGIFQKVINNLGNLASHPRKDRPRIFINSVISESSVGHLHQLIDIAGELGVDALWLQHLTFLTPRDVRAHEEFSSIHFTQEETDIYFERTVDNNGLGVKIRQTLGEVKAEARKAKLPLYVTPDLSGAGIESWYRDEWSFTGTCVTPWNSVTINPAGDVIPCPVSHFVRMGNIREESFHSIWNGPKYIRFRKLLREKRAFPGCNRCCKA